MAAPQLKVRVVEEAAAYRRGLEESLTGAGHQVVVGDEAVDLVLVAMRSPADCARVEEWAGRSLVLALVAPGDAATVAHALSHGAVGAVDWHLDTGRIIEVAEAAARGDVLLPAEIARRLPGVGADAHAGRPEVDDEETEWLEALAQGSTVVGLADDYGYSERVMFRRLHDLYTRLGAANRSEALVAAARLGLVGREPD